MDKITKFLLRLSHKERLVILSLMENIKNLNLQWIYVKKLKWEIDLYRIRKGKIRIIFRKMENSWLIIDINYRDKIYKN